MSKIKPDGTEATLEEYLDSWSTLAVPFKEVLGFELVSCDPGLTIRNPSDKSVIQLTADSAARIGSALKELERRRAVAAAITENARLHNEYE